ncbi:thymidine phosphorylase [Anaerobacterium chartisolvens]|uniref:Pyrimidine-nucleoside phosphorylase n=1 Tax=Anaerobacterium chartisolvens TaxID=1297424 RepID=A0A369BCP4_9FIRM|nr:pyrimidine-nucleoside phosphorylase [Anaerobacterium chartisolvens]RCX19309.1 thymidine phosphorylase [Anaerobacterium chartisolvens]
MRMVDLINKKKNGEFLSGEEINYIVRGYTEGQIPDYQMSAFLMAVCLKGMNREEISSLTSAFVDSGERVDLSQIEGVKVDKHSSGGVGDKVSIALIPICACIGIPVAKMSGRGLGHTGGTIDKLEAIPGFKTSLSRDEFISNVNRYKMAIVGQSPSLTPADKKIYALRDVTATVDSIPLIASSIMSKKIAAGADAIVLDVKVGSGAFMKSLPHARELASTMVDIGKSLGRKTVAIITDMSQPLGYEVGNANEVREVISLLKGEGAEDLTVTTLTIASYMAVLGGAFTDFDTAYRAAADILKSGRAVDKLKEFVTIQGGRAETIDNPGMLSQAEFHIAIESVRQGYVSSIDAESIGVSSMLLGAGRRSKEDGIDYSAGITMLKKIGDKVDKGERLCILHTNMEDTKQAEEKARNSFCLSSSAPAPIKHIHEVIQ